ncbi:unnamed protein product [Urochloa humidicola]
MAAAAAAIGKLLRSGGRSSASSSHLLPAIGRQMQQGGLSRFLPRPGPPPAAPAAGTRRLMNTESFPSKLNMLKNDYKQIKGSYQPYNSVHVILDLQKKVYKIGQKTKLYRRRWGLSSVLVTVFGVMALTVWGVHGDKEANKKALTELQQSLAKTESDVEKLKKSINESKKIRVVSNAAENH